MHVGAKIKFVDNEKNSFKINYNSIENLITKKTKAIILVDLAGVPADYEKAYEIVEKCKYKFDPSNEIQEKIGRIAIIADAAHSFGARLKQKRSGNLADFTSFSFHAVKNLTTAEGGAATWKDHYGLDNDEIYKKYQLLSLHGQNKDALHKNQLGAWEYDIIAPLYKCNMTDIMASIGLAQLKRYPRMLKRRQEIIYKYDEGFKELDIQTLNHTDETHMSSGHLYILRVNKLSLEQRNDFIIKMAEKGIACNVHYKPLPLLTAYKNLGFDIKDYPNAYDYYHNEITLPLYSKLTDDEVNYIIQSFIEVYQCF